MAQMSLYGGFHVSIRRGRGRRDGDGDGRVSSVHRLAVSGFLEDLRRHVAWRAAGGGENVELLLVHDA